MRLRHRWLWAGLVVVAALAAGELTARWWWRSLELRQGYAWTVGTHLVDLSFDEFCQRQAAIQRARAEQGMERGQSHPELAWTYNPGFRLATGGLDIRINSWGLRDEEFPREKPAGEFRILCLGGSTTAGEEVGQDQTYPARLAALLHERLPERRIRVINAGIPSYALRHSLRDLELRLWRFSPDLVTVYHGINELFDHGTSSLEVHAKHNYTGRPFTPFVYEGDSTLDRWDLATLAAPWRELGRRSQLAQLVRRAWNGRRGQAASAAGGLNDVRPEAIATFADHNRALLRAVRGIGAVGVPMTFAIARPGPFSAADQTRIDASFQIWLNGTRPEVGQAIIDAQNEALREVAREFQAPLAEIAGQVPADAQHFIDICHLTVVGNERVASLLADTVAGEIERLPSSPDGQSTHSISPLGPQAAVTH